MMQQPQPVQTRLQRLQGAWVAQEEIHPSPFDPVGGTATGRAVNRVALGGRCVLQEYTQYREGMPTLEGHGIFWHDEARDEYVMTWFDSLGAPPTEFRGSFEGDVMRLQARAPQGFNRATFEFHRPHAYRFSLEVSPDGQEWLPFMLGEYERVTG